MNKIPIHINLIGNNEICTFIAIFKIFVQFSFDGLYHQNKTFPGDQSNFNQIWPQSRTEQKVLSYQYNYRKQN